MLLDTLLDIRSSHIFDPQTSSSMSLFTTENGVSNSMRHVRWFSSWYAWIQYAFVICVDSLSLSHELNQHTRILNPRISRTETTHMICVDSVCVDSVVRIDMLLDWKRRWLSFTVPTTLPILFAGAFSNREEKAPLQTITYTDNESSYWVAMIGGLLKIIGLFSKRAL